MLTVEALSVTQPATQTTLVDDVNFVVQPGQVVGIVGPSGSGKTLTGLAVSGLLPPNLSATGSVTVSDQNLLTTSAQQWREIRGKSLAYVGQNALGCLHPVYRIKTQINEAITAHQSITERIKSKSQRRDVVAQLLESVGLSARVGELRANQLSGGMRQRVAIAIAMANNPDIIVADEITTALDQTTEQAIVELLQSLLVKHDIGVVMITHNVEALRRIADEIVVIDEGKVVEAGRARELLERPESKTWSAIVEADQKTQRRSTLPEGCPTLVVDALTKTYRTGPLARQTKTIVDESSFVINTGETVGLVGVSGSGKTTIARVICGLSTSTSGTVYLESTKICPAQKVAPRREIQLVFQDPFSSMNPRKRVLDQVAEPLIVQKADRHEALDRGKSLLIRMGLSEENMLRYPSELSGGQLQRAGIARAVIVEPKVIVLDEPVAALDLPIQQAILDLLIEVQEETGVSYLFISHDRRAVQKISHRILELDERKLRPISHLLQDDLSLTRKQTE